MNAGGSGLDYALFLGDDSIGKSRSGGGRADSAGFESLYGRDSGLRSRSSSSGGVRKTQDSSSSITHSPMFLERKTTISHSGGYDGECNNLSCTVGRGIDWGFQVWNVYMYRHL